MKTTIELSDALLRRARRVAEAQGTTLRALVEEGLSRALAEREQATRRTGLELVTFGGSGLRAGVDPSLPRSLAYDE